jgi:hypothetical protein
MAQELDFTDPEHMAGSTMAAFALAQLSFSALVTNEIIPKAEAEKMLKQLIKANEKGSIANEVAAALLDASGRSLAGRRRARMISWIMTTAALACLFAVVLVHGEPCSGSTAQQVTTIARMGAQPGLLAFFCGECGMADGIWSLAPIAPSDEIAPVRAVTEPPRAVSG